MPTCVRASHPGLERLHHAGETGTVQPEESGLLRRLATVPDPCRRHGVPRESTICRMLEPVDGDAFDAAV
ncbi:hypothetical protein [Streptomyces halobius]|uniref:Uncharacterized protein n=1 Tax=Streptomyces halobius TaxID=2879846 RepID=A0ABY4M505_9ACTN|nr:hypothetical protein [Streptomyces halobius]UQA91450.1 hypothetical protein K9S39_05765 [Streptomyces halobius]